MPKPSSWPRRLDKGVRSLRLWVWIPAYATFLTFSYKHKINILLTLYSIAKIIQKAGSFCNTRAVESLQNSVKDFYFGIYLHCNQQPMKLIFALLRCSILCVCTLGQSAGWTALSNTSWMPSLKRPIFDRLGAPLWVTFLKAYFAF